MRITNYVSIAKSNGMARKSDNLCNVACNDACKSLETMSRSIIDHIQVQI